MNNRKVPDPDWDTLLKQVLKDDLPPEAEARLSRHFFNLKSRIDRLEQPAGQGTGWPWVLA